MKKQIKGQITLEFIGSALFFVLVVIGVLSLTTDEIPQFHDDSDVKLKNLEAKHATDYLLTSQGEHSYEDGGTNWESSQETLENIESPGIAGENYMHIERSKLETMETIGTESEGVYNHSALIDYLELEHSYSFAFTWYPIVETYRSFTRTSPPDYIDLEEPVDCDDSPNDIYCSAANRVNYGQITLNDNDIYFLTAAYDGEYNTTYVSDSWDFEDRSPYGEGEVPFELDENRAEQDFEIKEIQNRDNTPGAIIVLESHLHEFGSNPDSATGDVNKLNRYPILEDSSSSEELVKMEVLVW